MTLTRWSPIGGLATLEVNQLQRMFDAAFNGDSYAQSGWMPAVDILETADKDIVVKAELPDMKREDISITFENDVLTIQGERKFVSDTTAEKYYRMERGYGTFRRSFTVAPGIDGDGVLAEYRDGVLTVTLPRRAETKPRQIQVKG